MNVRVRSLGVVALVALAWSAAPLAAQSAADVVPDTTAAAATAATAAPDAPNATRAPLPSLVNPIVPAPPATSRAAAVRGPSVNSARVAAHMESSARGAAPALQNRSSNRNAVAMMIVGGAALVIGAVIGDEPGTLVMLGGAAVGLYGLYLFLT